MTTWYLEAKNDHPPTNAYFVRVIGEQNSEYLYQDMLCADGTRRNLFRCPRGYFDVRRAIAAIPEYGLRMEIFKEEGDGSIVHFNLWKEAIRKRRKHANLMRGVRSLSGT